MKRLFLFVFILMMPIFTAMDAKAADKAAIAKEMVDKAITHYKAVGFDKAAASFNDKNGGYVNGEFYVIIFTKEGIFKTHAINPKLIDNPKLPKLKDVNGKVILTEMVNAGVNNPNGGWAEYTWTNPATKKLAPKKTWVRQHDDLLFGVGYYD
ncbi:cache domain-containing protein [Terasakiella sp. SH-1]|uniref:cache domain-containing protein n=1 Tax=Terasakiella sp. SH-1 TaxID=2560057 RepID=UPI0010737A7D|nr:cache domain-containing protein [Terasakiella sp. SH-1]